MDRTRTMVVIGRLGSSYGIRGWVRVSSFTEPKSNIQMYRPWWMQQGHEWRELVIEDQKMCHDQFLVKFKDYDTPECVRRLANCLIGLEALPSLQTGQYYWSDLEGYQVINTQQQILGHVVSVFETGANDVIVIKTPHHCEQLIPYIDSVVQRVDCTARTLCVDWDPE